MCSSESRGISIMPWPGWGNWAGRLTNGPSLATSSCASMRMLADLSLPCLVVDYQLTHVVNVTVQLSNVAVLDNCKSAYNNGVKC